MDMSRLTWLLLGMMVGSVGCGPGTDPETTPTSVPASLLLSTDRLDFGTVAADESTSLSLAVFNEGGDGYTLQSVSISPVQLANIFTVSPMGPVDLPADGTLSLTVTFSPHDSGALVAELVIETNDPGAPELKADLVGVGSASNDVDLDGDGWSVVRGDCNDGDTSSYPGADELCGDAQDNNCDGEIDNRDVDSDGQVALLCGGEDCDDEDAAIYDGAPEFCDGLSSSCSDVSESEAEVTFYPDVDHDGWATTEGDTVIGLRCDPPTGYAEQTGDCDDADSSVNPGEEEVCDGADLDNDCDVATQDYSDVDSDGFSLCAGDCSDNNPNTHPTMVDINSVAAVPDGSPGAPFPSIGAGLAGDAGCRQVRVLPGTYVEDLELTTATITVVGVEGSATTIVRGLGDGPVVRLLEQEDRTPLAVVFKGLTFTGGIAAEGAGIYARGAFVTLIDVVIQGNLATVDTEGLGGLGGAMYLAAGSFVQMTGGAIHANDAQVAGGGVFLAATTNTNDRPQLNLVGTRITENRAPRGGGIFADEQSLLDFAGAEFSDNEATGGQGGAVGLGKRARMDDRGGLWQRNTAAYGGGALAVGQQANADVSGSIILGNTALLGGGILNTGGTLTMAQSWMESNRAATPGASDASGSGGALYLDSGARTTLANLVLVGNAGNAGGALFAGSQAGRTTMTNSTLAWNSSGPTLGTVTLLSPDLTGWDFRNLIIAFDTTALEWVVNADSADVEPLPNILSWSDLSSSGGSTWAGTTSADPFAADSTNMDDDPLLTAPSDGRPLSADVHLLPGSPARDHGDSDPAFDDIDGSRCDMGAYGGPGGDWQIALPQ